MPRDGPSPKQWQQAVTYGRGNAIHSIRAARRAGRQRGRRARRRSARPPGAGERRRSGDAALGSGGAACLEGANATLGVDATDAFRHNAAAAGGGGVFYFDAQTTAAPDVPAGTSMYNNSALYGDVVASNVVSVSLVHDDAVREASSVPLAAPLVATALDAASYAANVMADAGADLISPGLKPL